MKVVVTSAFRNVAKQVGRYFYQAAGLYVELDKQGDRPYFLLGEGDSLDLTRHFLLHMMQSTGLPGKLIDVTHGGPVFGSIINTARFGQLAGVYNKIWQHIPEDAEVVVFMEGDLIWDPTVLVELINRLQQYPAVSPMIFTESTRKKYRHFYDIWAYAVGGVDFKNKYPYHSNVNGKPVALDSCGSCVVMRAEAARQVHFPADDMVRGMTRLLAKNGSPVWLQPDLAIEHPK